MRVCLFTDTLGDVNGVSRFIRNIAEQSLRFGRELHVLTSTRFQCPGQPNIHNIRPIYARAMPKYEQLEIVIAPKAELFRRADQLRPDAVHVSTPGPVGIVGRAYARKRGLPLLGTYHTDFPAYIDHLFDDAACTWICTQVMKWFYRPFDRIFTRSDEYARSMVSLGVDMERIPRLLPGIDTDTFHTRFRDEEIWERLGVPARAPKALYVGRVSVEKNLPLLTRVWKLVHASWKEPGEAPVLVVVGDGPYRKQMEVELEGKRAHFLGFRHGAELSTIYASGDAFLFPSTTDTLGQVVMEAQSAGLPVVVTDQGGPAEVVNAQGHAEQTGYVLPAEDAQAWRDTIIRLLADAPLRRTLGERGHRKIQPMSIRHSFEHFWDEHEKAVQAHRIADAPVRAPAEAIA
jgi:glycosyltransferase involved in cell wall biosynthesis